MFPLTIFRMILLQPLVALIWAAHTLFTPSQPPQQEKISLSNKPVFASKAASNWADSVLTTLTAEQKIGQLLMVAAYTNKGPAHEQELSRLVTQEHIGGLIFFQGGPGRQLHMTQRLQNQARIGLMIGIDGEWGLNMRLDSTFRFPWPLTVGAVQDSALVYQMGREIGKHCKRIGIHFNFAPVVDINTNPNNPIINARSFGEDRNNVLQKASAYMAGMQAEGVMASAKHFPGHGDTDSDSHLTLPVVNHNRERLDAVELYPYAPLFKQGLAGVMVAHLAVPALDSTKTPASISKPIVTGLLKEKLGFEGLIITDALNMKGVANANKPGEVEVKAFLAGNDILLFPQDVAKAKTALQSAMANGTITEKDLNARVHKILMAKYWLGLNKKVNLNPNRLQEDLNNVSAELLRKKIMEEALTVLVNRDKTLPLRPAPTAKIAVVGFGNATNKALFDAVQLYHPTTYFEFDPTKVNDLLFELSQYDYIIAGYYTSDASPWKSYKPDAAAAEFARKLQMQGNTVFVMFSNPYALAHFKGLEQANGVVLAYQNTPDAAQLSAELLFGAIAAKGRIPVSVGNTFQAGYGLFTHHTKKLRYGMPEEVGFDRKRLADIDKLVNDAIREGAMPGAQVLVARKGTVFFHKAYGRLSYDAGAKVQLNTIYDLASITKMAATVTGLMYMYDEGLIDLDAPLQKYLPEARGTNKGPLTLRNLLAHQAGLKAWIPFYVQTVKNQNLMPEYYQTTASAAYPRLVADGIYTRADIKDSIFKQILQSPLQNPTYLYSDLGFYFYQEILERQYRTGLDAWMQENFYGPLGAHSMGYLPLKRFPKSQIAPTENDKLFRNTLVHGHVHDQGAAMMGGVAGHAGLFSNANDLAKLMQMFLQKGHYDGVDFIQPQTLDLFTSCQFCVDNNNRRGVGFDKPQLSGAGPTCGCVSMLSFGHTGFTGTIAWADPEEEIVYIFLSNRVHPDAENKKLISMNTRSKVQQVIYDALNSY